MTTLQFNSFILRRPEELMAKINKMIKDGNNVDVAEVAKMCLGSSATNDYLEKIAVEAIGAKHLSAKLGADGLLPNGKGVEAKPCKKTIGSSSCGVVNDDTGAKLLETHTTYGPIVFVNAEKDGSRINWAVAAPYAYWEGARFQQIVKRLALEKDSTWSWGTTYPESEEEKKKCLDDLVKRHKPNTYVRSSPLSLKVLEVIPRNEIIFWKHPDVETTKLNKILRPFV
jgi:hypothetical protein